jgi:UDPglucose--hexose-1-phosphate uridylyltransferase
LKNDIDINSLIARIAAYAIKAGLICDTDKIWAQNMFLSILQLDSFKAPESKISDLPEYPCAILSDMSAWAVDCGLIENMAVARELFESRLCAILTPRPSQFISNFEELKKLEGPQAATSWMYQKQKQCDYIKSRRIAKNIIWKTDTQYGKLDMTINLSKPERSPEEIEMIKKMGSAALNGQTYPKCVLCPQNEGYAGRLDYPPRQNLRMIPLTLNGERWFFQYSPYVYYNEHCIVLSELHTDMLIDKTTFVRLADFLEQFPHYFIGSNADLPIVGGSILNHDHYQGGKYVFPLHRAKTRKNFTMKNLPALKCEILDWPLSVIRLRGSRSDVLNASQTIFEIWRDYSDAGANISAYSGQIRHNTITPIAKIVDGVLQMDLTLRNNAVSQQFPEGIFHSHKKYHHIKRENIGLIEVMGLAILPARLKEEFELLADCLIENDLVKIKSSPEISKHYDWALELNEKYKFTKENADDIIKTETARAFAQVLQCCGVFKKDEAGDFALEKFLKCLK